MARSAGKRIKFDIWPAVESLGFDQVIEQLGVDRVIEQVGAKEFLRRFGLERLLASLTPAQRLKLKRQLK